MQIVVTEPAISKPVTLSEAKIYCKIDDSITIEDQLIAMLIDAVTDSAEKYTGLSFVTKTLTVFGKNWDCHELPYGPHQSITSVVRINHDSSETVLTTDEYSYNGLDFLTVQCGRRWRLSQDYSTRNLIKVTYVAGFGDASKVPSGIKIAILKEIAELYENRENTLIGTILADLSTTTKTLLAPYKRNVLI